ncbi:putative nuclease harbi1, partial [Nowakowskiella sp. JEL0078]
MASEECCMGFEKKELFPNCYLAVNGTLVEIERPKKFEGWYCQKGFPAFNVQIVVDHKMKICDLDIRPGCNPDKSVFSYSRFGNFI